MLFLDKIRSSFWFSLHLLLPAPHHHDDTRLVEPRPWWPLGKLRPAKTKTQNEDVVFTVWSFQAIFFPNACWKSETCCLAVIMFQSSAILLATTVDYGERTDQQWKTEPGCFLLGRLCLNILLWKRVGGRTHSVANRSLFSKHSWKSLLSSVQETSISVQCQFSISDSRVPLTVPETHTMCRFCCRGLKTSCSKSDVMPVCLMPLEGSYAWGATLKKRTKSYWKYDVLTQLLSVEMHIWATCSGISLNFNSIQGIIHLFKLLFKNNLKSEALSYLPVWRTSKLDLKSGH